MNIVTQMINHHGDDATKLAIYIGDGVYVINKKYELWLYTEREDITHFIVIDPFMLVKLAKINRNQNDPD